MRAQADAIVGPTVLTLIEKRLWLARVVRANLAFLDPEIDGDLLVSLDIDDGRKQPRVRKMRIFNKLTAIRLDSRLAGDEPPKPKESTDAEKSPAGAGWCVVAPNGLVIPFEHCGWGPKTPPNSSPDTPAPSPISRNESSETPADSPRSQTPIWERTCGRNSVSRGGLHAEPHANPESSRDFTDIPPKARDFTVDPSSPFTSHESPITNPPSSSSPATSDEPPIANGYIAPVFPPPRPRFDPGPDYPARERARRRQPVVRHLWDQH
jgi:hypothetical protein